MPAMDEHDRARSWLEGVYRDPSQLVGLCWPALYAFVRVVSSRRIMGDAASSPAHAWSAAMMFADQANVRFVEAGPAHGSIASELLTTPGITSNDVPDVQLAALAIEHGLTLCSRDHGFARFGRLSWTDPLSG
jgi:uncharacterized protein